MFEDGFSAVKKYNFIIRNHSKIICINRFFTKKINGVEWLVEPSNGGEGAEPPEEPSNGGLGAVTP